MVDYYNTAATESDFTLANLMDSFHKVKAGLDRLNEKALKSAAKMAEIECPTCHRKVTVINRGDIVACEHIIEALKATCAHASPGVRPDPLAMKVFRLDDGPARFDDSQFDLR